MMPAIPPEYEVLYGWERRACLKRFKFHLDRGVAAHPEKPEVVWDRAVYLGYRGGLQMWTWFILASYAPIVVVAIALQHLSWQAIPIGVCVIPPLLTSAMPFLRLVQAHKRHPNWRRYNIYVDKTDWDATVNK